MRYQFLTVTSAVFISSSQSYSCRLAQNLPSHQNYLTLSLWLMIPINTFTTSNGFILAELLGFAFLNCSKTYIMSDSIYFFTSQSWPMYSRGIISDLSSWLPAILVSISSFLVAEKYKFIRSFSLYENSIYISLELSSSSSSISCSFFIINSIDGKDIFLAAKYMQLSF